MGERRIHVKCRFLDRIVEFTDDGGTTLPQVTRLPASHDKALEDLHFKSTLGSVTLNFQSCDSHPEPRKLLSDLWMIEGVEEVRRLHEQPWPSIPRNPSRTGTPGAAR